MPFIDYVGDPQDYPQRWRFTRRIYRTQYINVLMANIYYSENTYKTKSAKEKIRGMKFIKKTTHKFPRVLPVESQRLHLIPPIINCDNM